MIKTIIFQKENYNFDCFIASTRKYLDTKIEIPALLSNSSRYQDANISTLTYFIDTLLEEILSNKSKFNKDLLSILTYGYIGESRGGKNGIALVSNRDTNLLGIIEKSQNGRYKQFAKQIEFDTLNMLPVKVVTHRSSGERITGIISGDKRRAILYEIKTYKK